MTSHVPRIHSIDLYFVLVIPRAPGITEGDRIGGMISG